MTLTVKAKTPISFISNCFRVHIQFLCHGAERADSWEYAENSSPEEIYLKSQKTAKGNEEAGDHLLGTTDFEVTEEGGQVFLISAAKWP